MAEKKARYLIFPDSEFKINLYKVTKDGLYIRSLLPDDAKILKPGEWTGFRITLPKKIEKHMVRKKITQTSITNNLILWLSITIGIILIIINSIYLYVISNQMNNQLQLKADKQAHNIAQILASPLWNMDINQITGIANAYLESEEVVKIIVYDQTIVDFEKILFQSSKEPENISFTLKKNILYDKEPIGLVEIADRKSVV